MSKAHDCVKTGNINGLQDEINRDPNVVNEKSAVRE